MDGLVDRRSFGLGQIKPCVCIGSLLFPECLEIDDITQAIKAVTDSGQLPALHYWSGVDWKDVGVAGNVDWLKRVSKEIASAIKAVADNHLEGDVPVIIEGDFLDPALISSFDSPRLKALFVYEPDSKQIVENYLAREGGELQHYRADISGAYGGWIADRCKSLGLTLISSRPWDTLLERAVECLE